MFDFKLTLAALAVAILAAAYAVGRIHGDYLAELAHAHERAAAEKAYSDALTVLASAVTEADAAATEQRAKAQSLARQVTRSRDAQFKALPAADCVVPDDRRVLVGATYCARFPAHPACVQGELRELAGSAAGDEP